MKKSNKALIIITSVILIFAILNPTRNDFIEFLGYEKNHNMKGLKREKNYIIFSIYTRVDYLEDGKYLAILKNFIKQN